MIVTCPYCQRDAELKREPDEKWRVICTCGRYEVPDNQVLELLERCDWDANGD